MRKIIINGKNKKIFESHAGKAEDKTANKVTQISDSGANQFITIKDEENLRNWSEENKL